MKQNIYERLEKSCFLFIKHFIGMLGKKCPNYKTMKNLCQIE